jgi:short-subunit dehydrogenase
MQQTTARIIQIDNGYIVEVFPTAAAGTIPGPAINQYCADKNAVATYLVAVFVPGATYTPPAS